MVLNDGSLTNQKDGLSNSLNLTNQDFYIRLADEKDKQNNSVLAGRSFSLPRSFWLSPLSTACHAGYTHGWNRETILLKKRLKEETDTRNIGIPEPWKDFRELVIIKIGKTISNKESPMLVKKQKKISW